MLGPHRNWGEGGIEAVEFLHLTTTGRWSGGPREIEIWFTEADGRCYVMAEHGERAHWVRNIQAEPRVRLRIGEASFAAVAQVVDPTAERKLHAAVQVLSRKKCGWGEGLIVEVDPVRTFS